MYIPLQTLLLIFGAGILGIVVLLFALWLVESMTGLIIGGTVGGLLLGFQCLLLVGLKGWGEATSGPQGPFISGTILICIFSMVVYFVVGNYLIRKRSPKDEV